MLRVTLAGAALATGCATTGNLQPYQYAPDRALGAFAPVRVTINRDVAVPEFYLSRHDLIHSELKRSGAFLDIGPDVASQFVLDMRLARHTTDTAADNVGRLFSALTLFLIPSRAHNVNRLEVNCYVDGMLVRRYEYSGAYEEILSIYNYDTLKNGGEEFVSLRNLVHHLIRDLDRDNFLPRLGPDRPQPDASAVRFSI